MASQSLNIPIKSDARPLEACWNCHFRRLDNRCHAHPPQFRNADVQFPPVEANEWCGEWKPAQIVSPPEKPKR